LGDEARHVLRSVPADRALELVCAAQAAAGAVGAAIGVRRADLRHVLDHRLVLATALCVAAEPGCTQAHAVEALPPTHHQVLFGFGASKPVLPRELDRP